MSRLIDADKLKETLVIMSNKCDGALDILDISDTIEKAPTLEKTHGYWGLFSDCSNCGRHSDYRTPFCAWCGADMGGE